MARPEKKWRIVPAREDQAALLAQELGLSPVVAQVLLNRGIDDEAAATRFLHGGTETFPDPYLMVGMEQAVARIGDAIGAGQKITVYGDYDVDGVTATALLYRVLVRLGGTVDFYIPERQSEGYGLNAAALESLYRNGTRLVVTVDCGISAVAEVAALAGRIDVIVTDHHQPPEVLPPAYAILNPKQEGCSYPDKNLAGVGVAFKLCQALWRRLQGEGETFTAYLELVAVGTVADIVPLTGENRTFAKLGLACLASTENAGLLALMKEAGLAKDKLDAGRVGFVIAPRLNAAGRLRHASAGVELLITDDGDRAAELAAELEQENSRRQAVEKELLAAAEETLAGSDPSAEKVLVLAGEDWHPGVIGIVASRLLDRYYRPVVMISVRDGLGKGSCRSVPGFDIYRALEQCADLLVQFGGHRYAAGLTVEAANIEALRVRLNELAAAALADDFQPVLDIDSRVALAEIDAGLVEQLVSLAPYGMGNPCPIFSCEELAVTGVRPVGQDGRHLRLRVRRAGASGEVIGWDMGGLVDRLNGDAAIDLAFVPEFNDWQGQRHIQLRACDVHVRPAVPEQVRLIDARREDKDAYLTRIMPAGEKMLIVVGDRRTAVSLTRRLRRQWPAESGTVGCRHMAMSPAGQQRRQEAFSDGRMRVLVTAGEYHGCDTDITAIVLYDLPPSNAALAAYCRLATAQEVTVAMHFAFGGDRRVGGQGLEDLYPDRTAVGWVYVALKELAGPDGVVRLSLQALSRAVTRRSGKPFSPECVAATLAVLAEVGLVRREGGAGEQVCLMPEPVRKLALEQSAAYRAGVAARQRYSSFSARLLRMPPVALWKAAMEGE